MEMEDQRESGGSYTFPTDGAMDLEAFIDAKLAELDVATLFEKATEKLDIKLRQQERKTREVNQIFTHCESQLKQFKHNIEMDQGIMDKMENETAAGGDADSDDDVQIVQTAYEPQLANRRQQQMQPYQQRFPGPQRAGMPQGMQQNFTMRGGTLIRHPHQQASGGVRQQFVGQQFPRPQNPASRFSAQQAPGPRNLASNKSTQGGPRMPGEHPMTVTQRRPNTTMNAPPTKHADLVVGMKLFGKKFNDIWYKGTLVEIHDKDKPRSEWRYRIKFDSKGLKVLPGREIAFIDSPTDILPVGSRVVALYKDEDSSANTAHYAGIVSESPSLRNSQRYLIFFDDGYAQYCASKEIHKVYEQSRNVWEDIHPDSQEFIKSYLKQYPERPMVRLQPNQIIKTEWNGRWWTARVLVTDASLVKMYFDADKRVEWIYRGSTRLEPLYTELTNAEISKASGKGHRRHNLGMKSNKKPIVEYLRGTDEDFMRRKQPVQNKPQPPAPQPAGPPMQRSLSADNVPLLGSAINKKRHVARKSTGKPQPEMPERPPAIDRRQFQTSSISRHSLGSSRDLIQDRLTSEYLAELNEGDGGERMAIDMGWKDVVRKTYYPHRCRPTCLDSTELDPVKFRGYNPLIIPMLCGWERQISKQKNTGKRAVFYRGPCARRMRSLAETEQYLRDTDAMITIDMFCYDAMLHTHSEFVPIKTFCDIKDLSYGKETVRISCVNGIDRQYPDYVEYSNQRIPAEGVHLNLDADFLVGCDCTDDTCGDPEKCSCARLTLEASRVIPGPKPETLGYQYRRLKEPVTSGIYECNQRCKCSSRCNNRVAQNGLQLRLQVFKTEKRGWGLRSLDDIPAGGFICVYAGQLLTEQGANEDGQQYGDEYLAELDYIEVVERTKEGYESDVDINLDDEGIEQDRSRSGDDDDDEGADNYNAPSDSDSTFSGDKFLTSINLTGTPERKSNRKRTKKVQDGEKDKDEKKSTKIVIKRGADQDKSWSVKVKSPQAKTKEWVDSIPDPPAPMTIVISDEEDSSGSKADKSKNTEGKTDVKSDLADDSKSDKKSETENAEGEKIDAKDENKDTGENDTKEESDDKKDSDLDSCGEKKLEKPKTTSPSKVTINLKSSFMSEVHIDEASIDPTRRPIRVPRIRERGIGCTNSDKGSADGKADSAEPTASGSKSHPGEETEKQENKAGSESSHGSKKTEKAKTPKGTEKDAASNNSKGGSGNGSDKSSKQTKNRLSRFSGLPDPKSQQVISPIKIKLMKEAPDKKAEAAAKKKEKKQALPIEDEEDHGFKTRLLYNNEDFCYVMDAKSMGNLGRYLNHNCAPNVFVQNVFVDTHDMRFPWVAFFAGQYIRAGTELTWDYNYEVGSVPGKVLYCYCGAAECRGRLL